MKTLNFSTKHELHNWSNWSDNLNSAIAIFKNKFGVLPSYIIANEHTHSQIDFITNISAEKKDMKHIKSTHFIFEKQFIDFVYDSNLKDKAFELQYDSFFEFEKSSTPKVVSKNITILHCRTNKQHTLYAS